MRYVDLDSLRGPPAFEVLIAAAETAGKLVAAEPDAVARKALITKHRQCWVAFREPLETLAGKKCWYTESRNPGTDDDIDHFRPKGGVTGCDHGGYWWEAFNWKNFRLSSHRANRPRGNAETGRTHGKGNHFPLIVEDDRWMSPSEESRERPSLLDPTDPCDPPMLTYGVDGRAALAPDYRDEPDAYDRIEASRRYFHLDAASFVEDRTALYGRIAKRVEDGERVAVAALDGEASARETLKSAAGDLIGFTRPDQPYSKAAVAYIRVYRDRAWVRKMVLGNVLLDSA